MSNKLSSQVEVLEFWKAQVEFNKHLTTLSTGSIILTATLLDKVISTSGVEDSYRRVADWFCNICYRLCDCLRVNLSLSISWINKAPNS